MQTRFLYPFVFNALQVEQASQALRAERFGTRGGESQPLWECAKPHLMYSEPHHLYKDELLDHAASFLFPDPERKDAVAKGCGYFKVADVAAHKWFRGAVVRLGKEATLPVDIVSGVRIELFLTPQGVGVLSVALTPKKAGLSLDEALEFNYRIAQFRRHPVARFRKAHPLDEDRPLSPEQRAGIPEKPDDSAPLAERLGAPGGSFDMTELIGHLLAPLEKHGTPTLRRWKSEELAVYTVARFGPEANFADRAVREQLAPSLAGLAQVEEPGHSGTAPDDLYLSHGVLNTRHWAAVGLLGSVHLVSDQPPRMVGDQARDVTFNEQKVAIVRDKYFIPYLVALLQRHALNRAIDEAGRIVSSRGEDAAERLARLRAGLLEFAIGGHFTQVSTRQALHRYYQIARDGLDVPASWEEVRRAIADIDADNDAQRQGQIEADMSRNLSIMADVARKTDEVTRKMDENLGVVAHVQAMVEWIEIFLVSVYAAHLWHMFAETFPPLGHGEAKEWFVSVGVVVLAALAGGITAFVLKPWRLRSSHGHRSSAKG